MGDRRPYASAVRAEQARLTRRLVLEAARTLFLRDGYAGTTVAAVAREAGVSGQTVYNAFGSKAGLLTRLFDVTLVGDDEPVPFAQRPATVEVMGRTDPRALLHGYAGLGLVLLTRLGPLLAVVTAGAAAGDPDLRALLERMDAQRLVGTAGVAARLDELGALRPGVDVERARDALWTLNSLAVWEHLVQRRGWSPQEYADWVGRAMADAVLAP
ncbi:TetR/AcrR family transcriptional regulator [Vallicoccus soli]|uniref:TetR/AcrR family transcriptional regulator n=1 Tax=Vallicoccus soli TaxID=2339232 RepID=A0A3A3YUA4_9ACTN|nr:helix-turn-helix domain-containing protein [Vallicoccus soli]RJK94275.1 TetR/AcrR family transcriptional regulator [Vallicoccus soli]